MNFTRPVNIVLNRIAVAVIVVVVVNAPSNYIFLYFFYKFITHRFRLFTGFPENGTNRAILKIRLYLIIIKCCAR